MILKNTIPILDNCSIDLKDKSTILIDRLSDYVRKHADMVFPHKHNFYHIVLFTQGSGNHIIDFKQFQIENYQLYFMLPGQVHTWNFKGDEDGYIINFAVDYFQSFLLRTDYLERFAFFTNQSSTAIYNLPEQAHKKVLYLLQEIYIAKQENTAEDYIKTLLLQFFLLLENWISVDETQKNNSYNYTIYSNFIQLVEQQFIETRLPREFAEQLFVTPNHLNAICKAYIGLSSGEIIRNRIILEAKRLLINKNMNINEIANELQFKDNSYFTKFFKKSTGFTPEEFRKQIY